MLRHSDNAYILFSRYIRRKLEAICPLELRFFGYFSAVLISSVALLALLYTYFPSPREKELLNEIKQMENKYAEVNAQMDV